MKRADVAFNTSALFRIAPGFASLELLLTGAHTILDAIGRLTIACVMK